MQLPKISLVTPSFNQAAYLEATIESVLSQGYPDLEYFVIDGGSTDGSVDILKRYEGRLSGWVSEPDRGQSYAIAKGFARATGDVLGWLCSDDLLKPGALSVVGGAFAGNPSADVVYGDTEYLYPSGRTRAKPKIRYDYDVMLFAFNIPPQPSTFFTRAAYERAGGVDVSMHYAMDYDLFLRMGSRLHAVHVPLVLSSYRLHRESKTMSRARAFEAEWKRARERALGRPLTTADSLRWHWYMAKVVFRFWAERGEIKLGYEPRDLEQ